MAQYMVRMGVRPDAPVAAVQPNVAKQPQVLRDLYAEADQIFSKPAAAAPPRGINALVDAEFDSWEKAGIDSTHTDMNAYWSVSVIHTLIIVSTANIDYLSDTGLSDGLAYFVSDSCGLYANAGDFSPLRTHLLVGWSNRHSSS